MLKPVTPEALDAAVEFYRNQLGTLNKVIAECESSPHEGIRRLAHRRTAERDHLAVLLAVVEGSIDVILPDGTHRYWSTHCRHGHHDLCSATAIEGRQAGERVRLPRRPAEQRPVRHPRAEPRVPVGIRRRGNPNAQVRRRLCHVRRGAVVGAARGEGRQEHPWQLRPNTTTATAVW